MAEEGSSHEAAEVWLDFCAEFTDEDGRYRWGGCQLMDRIEEWAERWPGDVEIAGCNDTVFCSSGIDLICHRDSDGMNRATTVVYVPQCTGHDPSVFLLYPGHTEDLIEALQRTLSGSPPAP